MFGRKRKKVGSRRIVRRALPETPLKPVKAIEMIIKMRVKVDVTCSKLSTIAYVDKSYLRRLESGESRNPGRDTLIKLTWALVDYTKLFTEKDVDLVLAAAGFPPAPLRNPAALVDPRFPRQRDWS